MLMIFYRGSPTCRDLRNAPTGTPWTTRGSWHSRTALP